MEIFYSERSRREELCHDYELLLRGVPPGNSNEYLRLYGYGEVNYHAGFAQDCRFNWYVLTLTESGRAVGRGLDGRKIILHGGMFMFRPAMTRYSFTVPPGEELVARYLIIRNGNLIAALAASEFFMNTEVFSLSHPEKIGLLFDRVKARCRAGGENIFAELSLLIYAILLEVMEQFPRSPRLDPVGRALEFIDGNPERTMTRPWLEKSFGLSARTLNRQFVARTGASVFEYQNRKRMERAKLLLANRALPLGEVGVRCGYGDYSHFFRVFKKRVGVAPGEFRANFNGWIFPHEILRNNVEKDDLNGEILSRLRSNPALTEKELSELTGLSRRAVEWRLSLLKRAGRLRRVGGRRCGSWEIVPDPLSR